MCAKKERERWREKREGLRRATDNILDYREFHFPVWWTSWWVTGCVCLQKEMWAVAEVGCMLHHQRNMANWQIRQIFSNFPLLFFLQIFHIWIFLQELNSRLQLVSHLMQEPSSWYSHIKLFYEEIPVSNYAIKPSLKIRIIKCLGSKSVQTKLHKIFSLLCQHKHHFSLIFLLCYSGCLQMVMLVGRPWPISWEPLARLLWHLLFMVPRRWFKLIVLTFCYL